jgi:hypothetical protein
MKLFADPAEARIRIAKSRRSPITSRSVTEALLGPGLV